MQHQEPSSEPPVLPSQEPAGSSEKSKLLENRTLIFVMLFGVTGFLGIPVLCLSPAFSRGEKILWSVIVTIYTSALIAGTVAVVWWSYNRIVSA